MPRGSWFRGAEGFVAAGGISGALPAPHPQPLSIRAQAPVGARSLPKAGACSLPWFRCPQPIPFSSILLFCLVLGYFFLLGV